MTDEKPMTDYNEKYKGVAALSLYVSPINCEAVLGMKPREYREFVRRERLAVIERGKNRLVRTTEIVARLEAKALKKTDSLPESNTDRLRKLAGLGGRK